MKKISFIAVLFLALFVLAACGSGGILEDTEKEYYVTGNFAGWGDAFGQEQYELEAIELSDERVDSIRRRLGEPDFLYIVEITLPAEAAGWAVNYVWGGADLTFDGNLTVKMARTTEMDGEAIPDWWGPSPESGEFHNLTPNYMVMPTYQEEDVDGTGSHNDNPVAFEPGDYYFVFSQEGNVRSMGLIPR